MQWEDRLKELLETGKQKGYVTYEQVNEILPDDAVDPAKLDQLLLMLEEQGIELIDGAEASRRVILNVQPAAFPLEEATPDDFVPPARWPADVVPAPLTPPLPPTPPANADAAPGRTWPSGDPEKHRAFFASILADPSSNLPRLVYADWLDELGYPDCAARAEFIRVQVELAHLGSDDPRRFDLEEREQDLLIAHEADWLGPFQGLLRDLVRDWEYPWRNFLRDWRFERGFFTLQVYHPDDVLELAPILFEAGLPILVGIRNATGYLISQWPRWQEFSTSAHLGKITRVRSFDMDGGGGVVGQAVTTSPHLSSLCSLDLMEEGIWPAWLEAIAQNERLADLPSLELKLHRNYLGDDALRILAKSANFRCLTELELGDAQIDSAVITAEGVQALAESPHLSQLRRLVLTCCDIGPEGVKSLLTSPHLSQLRELALTSGNRSLRGVGLAQLAEVPAPDRLSSLTLMAPSWGMRALPRLHARRGWQS
jgi:uncharacterized protein (TIGR02996 family)